MPAKLNEQNNIERILKKNSSTMTEMMEKMITSHDCC